MHSTCEEAAIPVQLAHEEDLLLLSGEAVWDRTPGAP
jgi:hypothetical protein